MSIRHRSRGLVALIAAVGLALAVAESSVADEGPPVSVRLVDATSHARAGEPYEGALAIRADVPITLSGFRLEGDGWQQMALDAPASADMGKSGQLLVRFTALPRDPDRPLVVAFDVDGRTVRQVLDLSERHYRRMKDGVPAQAVAADAQYFTPPAKVHSVVAPPALPADVVAQIRPAPTGAQSYNITVTGRWLYELPGNTSAWVGVDEGLVRVLHDIPGVSASLVLGAAYTIENGQFSLTVPWDPSDGYPNLYVDCQTRSSHIKVCDHTYEEPYHLYTLADYGFTGTLFEVGNLSTYDWAMPAPHILSMMERNWRWHDGFGYDAGVEDVFWPADGEYHVPDGIHIIDDWNEGGYAHEYAHHWESLFADLGELNYCNGVCDYPDVPVPCSHCTWCSERQPTAAVEGLASWLGDIVPNALNVEYGIPITGYYSVESLGRCWADSLAEANTCEGYFAATLRDITDGTLGEQHNEFGAWRDMLSEGAEEIFSVFHNDNPSTPLNFFAALMARYPGMYRPNLWETAKNCGFEIDNGAPAVVTGLHSDSHTVNVSSADRTIELAWTNAADDVSGIAGYGIFVASGAGLPSQVQDIGKVTSYTTSALLPGTWYFNIRAVDRAGHWSATFASCGPYIIREPQPSDLEPHISSGWTRPLVPREDSSASGMSVPEPVTLVGNSAATWWNLNGLNGGEAASGTFTAGVFVDGTAADSWSWANINGGGNYMVSNDGPLTVRGGRHTFEVFHDAYEQVAETDETDNRWAHQYVWTPLLLTAGSLATRAAPPPYQAGWDAVVDGSTKSYNCDGLSLLSSFYLGGTASWDAVYLYATDNEVDYDCRMHVHSTGATDGFTGVNLAWSARSAGSLDAVIVNGAAAGTGTRDVGVLNDSGGTSDYRVMRLRASAIALDDSVTIPLAQYEMMAMRRFDVAVADTGWYTITVSVDPPTQTTQVQYYLPTFTTGPLSTYDARASTSTGLAQMNRHLTQIGRHGLVVYRDPRYGTDPCTLTIEMERTLPDFTPVAASGWHAPIVPRPAADGSPSVVALPDTLYGNANATYFNLCRENDSPVAWGWDGVHYAYAGAYLDGSTGSLASVASATFGAYQVRTYNQTSARTVAGGRHTATITLDGSDYVAELDETNNDYGEQYCWSPLVLSFATPVTRPAPSDRVGGWSQIHSGETRWYNCDGLRLPAGAEDGWRAVAVMPAVDADVDVRLHYTLKGAKNGFAANVASSAWGVGESDFALVYAHGWTGAPPFTAPFDAGVLLGTGTGDYTAEAVASTAINPGSGATWGPYTLAAGHVMQLYAVWLTPGVWSARLDNVSGSVNWGLSLYAPDASTMGKSSSVTNGISWLNGAGRGERLMVDAATTGWYALAVWKAGAADLTQSGSYNLIVHTGVTGTPDLSPSSRTTTLVAIYPNPFNPQTQIVYDIAAVGSVRLGVYDVRGTLVRNLVTGEQPAGRYTVDWDGRDASGRGMASGNYFARLEAGGMVETMRMVLIQ